MLLIATIIAKRVSPLAASCPVVILGPSVATILRIRRKAASGSMALLLVKIVVGRHRVEVLLPLRRLRLGEARGEGVVAGVAGAAPRRELLLRWLMVVGDVAAAAAG